MPSLESQIYASVVSLYGHVDYKTGNKIQALLFKYFMHIFLISLNDEAVHTGFAKMVHYLLALSLSPKS